MGRPRTDAVELDPEILALRREVAAEVLSEIADDLWRLQYRVWGGSDEEVRLLRKDEAGRCRG